MTATTLKIYLAGGFTDERMPDYFARLEALIGVTITHNWTLERDRAPEKAAVCDLEGVRRCQLLVAVMDMPLHEYRGTFTELGAAMALQRPVLVVSEPEHRQHAATNCFFWHPQVFHVTSFEKAVQVVRAVLNPGRKLLLLGHGGHGKDQMAETLREFGGLRFASSSEAANRLCVYPALRERYAYESEQQCFEDRRNHRMEWYELICAYNSEDRARLAKQILAEQDMYVGMRDAQEFQATRPLVDLVIWVDASARLPEKDPSLFIAQEEADLCVPNNGSLFEFAFRATSLMQLLKCASHDTRAPTDQ
jgi:hypothetical protein